MEARALKKHIRLSPRKIARLAKECRGKKLSFVKPRLAFLPQKAARVLLSTIHSAEANFLVKSPQADVDSLVIETLLVNKAKGFRRILYRAKGRADRMHRKASHIDVTVSDKFAKQAAASANSSKSTKAEKGKKTAVDAQASKAAMPVKQIKSDEASTKSAPVSSKEKNLQPDSAKL